MTWWKMALAGIAALAVSTAMAPNPAEAGRAAIGYTYGPAVGYGYRSYTHEPWYYRSTFYKPYNYQYPRYWWYYDPYPHYGYHPKRWRPAYYGYNRHRAERRACNDRAYRHRQWRRSRGC